MRARSLSWFSCTLGLATILARPAPASTPCDSSTPGCWLIENHTQFPVAVECELNGSSEEYAWLVGPGDQTATLLAASGPDTDAAAGAPGPHVECNCRIQFLDSSEYQELAFRMEPSSEALTVHIAPTLLAVIRVSGS